MNDLRTHLERARDLAPEPDPDLSLLDTYRRGERKARARRAGTVALSLAIGVAAIAGAYVAFREPADSGFGRGPTERPPTGPTVDLTVAPGEFAYESRVAYWLVDRGSASTYRLRDEGGTLERLYELESWFSPSDGSGRMRVDDPTWYGIPGGGVDRMYGLGELDGYEDSEVLSTDAATLLRQLIARSAPGGASPVIQPTPEVEGQERDTPQLVRAIESLLEYPDTSPELEAALFEVFAGLPGVEVRRGDVDPVGRPGTLLRVRTEGLVRQWWFDPGSFQALASRWTDPASEEVVEVTIVLAAGVVGSTNSIEPIRSFVPSSSAPAASLLAGREVKGG